MGFIPWFLASFTNLKTPNILPWSVMATADCPSALAFFISALISDAPSSNEYWVWECRWQKSTTVEIGFRTIQTKKCKYKFNFFIYRGRYLRSGLSALFCFAACSLLSLSQSGKCTLAHNTWYIAESKYFTTWEIPKIKTKYKIIYSKVLNIIEYRYVFFR